VAEFENELHSIVVAPCGRRDGSRLGGLAAVSNERGAFDQWQIEGLELAGRLIGAALDESINQVELRSA
jgi:GAF domain-containing protein